MGIAQAIADVVAVFRGVSVGASDTADGYPLRATSDPQDIQTPTVWVPVPDIEFQFGKRRVAAQWVAYIIAPNSPRQNTTTEHIGAIIDAVTGLFPFTSGEMFTLNLPGGTTAQAYKLSWQGHITIGD